MSISVIIAAAGSGRRMQQSQNKLLLPLGGKTILEQTVSCFSEVKNLDAIYVTTSEQDWSRFSEMFRKDSRIRLVPGGAERQDSIANAVEMISQSNSHSDITLVHDGARPFCSPILIQRVVDAVNGGIGAVIPVVGVKDTIRRCRISSQKIGTQGFSDSEVNIVPREELRATQTPQGFTTKLLISVYQMAKDNKWLATDDAALVQKNGHLIQLVEGSEDNLKITTPRDLQFAQWLFQQLEEHES